MIRLKTEKDEEAHNLKMNINALEMQLARGKSDWERERQLLRQTNEAVQGQVTMLQKVGLINAYSVASLHGLFFYRRYLVSGDTDGP